MNGAGDLSQQECQQLVQGLDRDQNGNLAILAIPFKDSKKGEGLVLVLWPVSPYQNAFRDRQMVLIFFYSLLQQQ